MLKDGSAAAFSYVRSWRTWLVISRVHAGMVLAALGLGPVALPVCSGLTPLMTANQWAGPWPGFSQMEGKVAQGGGTQDPASLAPDSQNWGRWDRAGNCTDWGLLPTTGQALCLERQGWRRSARATTWSYNPTPGHISRETWSEWIYTPQCSLKRCLQEPRHGSNLNIYQ